MSRLTILPWRPLGALTLLAALLLLSAPAADATSLTRIAPTERSGEFEFRAEGFRPHEEVSIRLTGPSGQEVKVKRDRANNRGRTSFKVFMPRHFQPGRWTITLRGVDSDRDAESRFDLPYRPPDATLTVDPPSAPLGATFTFSSGDFQVGEVVSYWLVNPRGESVAGGDFFASSSQITLTFATGPTTPVGDWLMTAYGQSSDHQAVAAFTVTE